MSTVSIYRTLRRLAKRRGIILIEDAPLPASINGLWYLTGSFEAITLNASLGATERRAFTLAHELGHSILHRHLPPGTALYDPRTASPAYARAREHEADAYAEQLLSRLKSA